MTKSKWETVGIITVDAGICWLGDPCYILHTDEDSEAPKDIGKTWSEFCDKLGNSNDHQFMHNSGGPGLGVTISTGGDGVFPVEVKRKDGMISEVRIKFF